MFMGHEIAQWNEWSEARQLDWNLLEFETHQKLQRFVRDLNALYQREPSLYQVDFDYRGFEWLQVNDSENSVFAFARFAQNRDDFLVVIANFTPVVRYGYVTPMPVPGRYVEVLNSDAEEYGGSGVRNTQELWTHEERMSNFGHALKLTLPPLGLLILRRVE
jgi:1,4-alpha-glucan branching enzyme